MHKIIKLVVAPALLSLMLVGVGCQSRSPGEITAADVRSNFSPEMFSPSRSFGQYQMMSARASDENGRQAWRDLAKVFMFDGPVHLSDYGQSVP
ncbi:MAG: hypothetical protein ACOCTI_07860 [Phycisphaeraceae bacterium]